MANKKDFLDYAARHRRHATKPYVNEERRSGRVHSKTEDLASFDVAMFSPASDADFWIDYSCDALHSRVASPCRHPVEMLTLRDVAFPTRDSEENLSDDSPIHYRCEFDFTPLPWSWRAGRDEYSPLAVYEAIVGNQCLVKAISPDTIRFTDYGLAVLARCFAHGYLPTEISYLPMSVTDDADVGSLPEHASPSGHAEAVREGNNRRKQLDSRKTCNRNVFIGAVALLAISLAVNIVHDIPGLRVIASIATLVALFSLMTWIQLKAAVEGEAANRITRALESLRQCLANE